MFNRIFARIAFGTLVAAAALPAMAQTAEEFYRKNTQLTMIVPTAAGGGYDSYARLLAKHMSKYIPGRPTIMSSNMPGGGGIVAANFVYNIAPKDGTLMAILAKRTEPRMDVVRAAKKHFGIEPEAWT